MGVLVQVEVITTTMECCIAYLCSLFSEVVHYRKSVKQRKPKAAIKGACHRFSKSVSVDGLKIADKNWSMQPNFSRYIGITKTANLNRYMSIYYIYVPQN